MPLLYPKSLGIIVALYDEAKDILENKFFQWEVLGKDIYYSYRFEIWLIISGIGKANASFALGRMLEHVTEVWILGTSGGLGNETIGSMYLSTEFVEHDMDATGLGFAKGVTPLSEMTQYLICNPPNDSVNALIRACADLEIKLFNGRTMSGDQFICHPEVVEQKKSDFGVHIVDMESAAVAKICQREGIPVLALRTISDNANHEATNNWNENVKQSSRYMNKILQYLLV